MDMNRVIFLVGLVSLSVTAYACPSASSARLDEVAERGRHVMPFHLEKTLHVFDKTTHGGIQQVIAKDPGDIEQIALIRKHLRDISQGFRQGDFSRQRRIHGDDMPGLPELASGYARVHFEYRDLPNGAEIEYTAEDSSLVDAIHRFFNAQLADHARHAVGKTPAQCKHKHHRHGVHQPSLPKE
jgi:hypothetical protein